MNDLRLPERGGMGEDVCRALLGKGLLMAMYFMVLVGEALTNY